ncbi:MAG TPA: SpoIIE family protein phosphatase [Streptosporangiaceae bacterium]|nr:SpoIIE family protein phosphatase [Streptosporangiaceae bacterium]
MDPVTSDALIRSAGLIQSPFCLVIFDTELRIASANEAAERLGDGIPATRWAGRRLGEVLPHLDAGLIEQSLRRVLATGEPVTDLEVGSRAGDDPGGERFWGCVQFRIGGPDGKAAGVAHVMREVTERAHSQRRLALADEASARIGTTLDITRTAEELLEVAIPRLADVGAVDLLATVIDGDQHAPHAHDQKMRLWRAAVQSADGSPTPTGYLRHAWLETDPAKLYHQRLVAGLPVYLPAFGAMTTEQIKEVNSGTGLDRLMAAHAAGAHSLMVVPLVARGVIMGMVVLYRHAGSEPFTPADLALAHDFVARAAVPLDNARLYTRELATALALQRGLLPRRIPGVPGLRLAYRYVPAETSAEIGGDWFDVIPLSQDRCALIVGDVTGHDMTAASLMGQLRTATRTLATLGLTPAQILTRLDQITADLTDAETSATCLYAVHDPGTGTCDIARAGHPLPAIARPGHPTAFPHLPPGLPLGTGLADVPYQATRLHLPRGSTLVLYTDGLIESPGADMSTGMARLARTLATLTTLPVTDACDTLLATLAPSPADDIAILMART